MKWVKNNINIIKENMKKFDKTYNKIINEVSLSRLFKHMIDHDTGIISAYRGKECDKKDPEKAVKKYTKKENQERNRKLLALLQSMNYDVISVKGAYIENYGTDKAYEVNEHSFFVVDRNDKKNLRTILPKLGKHFNQDSIIYILHGGHKAQLIGTKDDEYSNENSYPKLRKVVSYNNIKFGEKSEFMTRTSNRPFFFESVGYDLNDNNVMHRLGMYEEAKKIAKIIGEEVYQAVIKK